MQVKRLFRRDLLTMVGIVGREKTVCRNHGSFISPLVFIRITFDSLFLSLKNTEREKERERKRKRERERKRERKRERNLVNMTSRSDEGLPCTQILIRVCYIKQANTQFLSLSLSLFSLTLSHISLSLTHTHTPKELQHNLS